MLGYCILYMGPLKPDFPPCHACRLYNRTYICISSHMTKSHQSRFYEHSNWMSILINITLENNLIHRCFRMPPGVLRYSKGHGHRRPYHLRPTFLFLESLASPGLPWNTCVCVYSRRQTTKQHLKAVKSSISTLCDCAVAVYTTHL